MWNLKLVKFPNGTYGIRTGFIFHSYVDLENFNFTWTKGATFFSRCQGSEARARNVYDMLKKGLEIIG